MTSRIDNCSRCHGPEDEWTPGCVTCRERHRRRALRSGDPATIASYRAEARRRREQADQEFARAVRDGDPRFMTITRFQERATA